MKTFIFAVLLLVASSASAQYSSISVGNSCSYAGETMPYSVTSFRSDREADGVIQDILDASGLRPNFEISAAAVPNAAATIQGDKRWILYNQRFMREMRQLANSDWAAISIMAHEIGHHLNGHTLESHGSRPAIELEADEYSGFIVQKLGGSLDDALVAMEILGSDYGSRTHPAKRDRLAAITSGYTQAEQQGGGTRNRRTTNRDNTNRNDSSTQTKTTRSEEAYFRRCERDGVPGKLTHYTVRKSSGKLLNGKKCGEWMMDFGLDRVYTGTYMEDKEHGFWKEIGEFGYVVQEGHYKKGKKEGPWISMYEKGQLEQVEEGSYRNHKKDGRWEVITKYSSGNVEQKTEIYRHGILLDTITH